MGPVRPRYETPLHHATGGAAPAGAAWSGSGGRALMERAWRGGQWPPLPSRPDAATASTTTSTTESQPYTRSPLRKNMGAIAT